jgi:hypothetical protein
MPNLRTKFLTVPGTIYRSLSLGKFGEVQPSISGRR